jgi:hypothetical protein
MGVERRWHGVPVPVGDRHLVLNTDWSLKVFQVCLASLSLQQLNPPHSGMSVELLNSLLSLPWNIERIKREREAISDLRLMTSDWTNCNDIHEIWASSRCTAALDLHQWFFTQTFSGFHWKQSFVVCTQIPEIVWPFCQEKNKKKRMKRLPCKILNGNVFWFCFLFLKIRAGQTDFPPSFISPLT